jgi:phospholipase/carboxylesterase
VPASELPLVHLHRPAAEPPLGGLSPLLLLLHGVGSHEGDLFTLAPLLDERLVVLSLRAPVPLGPGQYGWFSVQLSPVSPIIDSHQAEASRRTLAEFIPVAVQGYSADPRRVFLLGFSQGAIMALAVALTRPELLAGAAVLNGRTLPELFAEDGPLARQLAPPGDLRGLPILVLHGLADPVLPIDFARETRSRLTALPIDLQYHELAGGHTITPEGLAIVQRWLRDRLDAVPGTGQTPP